MSTSENPEEIPDQPAGQEVEASEPASPDATPNRMTWMEDTLEWGVRAQPGKHGLTMRDINTGIYGDVPDESQDMSRRPRGAYHRESITTPVGQQRKAKQVTEVS